MGNRKEHSALKGFSFKEITKMLELEGFFPHHKNSTHTVFANAERFFVTIPSSNKKEVNHMMTTVNLQRIRNGRCYRMSESEYITLKQF